MPDGGKTPWTLRKWPQRVGLTLVVLIIATPILFVVAVFAYLSWDPLGLKVGGDPYLPREACAEVSERTFTSTPVDAEPDPVRDARMIERYGRVMSDVAAGSRPGSLRDCARLRAGSP